MNGAEFIVDTLVRNGIKDVFGYSGSAMLKIMDTMIESGKIHFIQNFHEQASAFAADAYSRVKGEMGCVLATSGPGTINILGGIADAYYDSIPLLAITGQDYSNNVTRKNGVRQNGFQDLDIVSVSKPITKYSVLISSIDDLAFELEKAIWIANEGRKGPVLVDVPIDIQFAEMPLSPRHFRKPLAEYCVPASVLNEFNHMLSLSRRPVILAGGGIRLANAVDELKKFTEYTKIPVVATLNGIDCGLPIYGFSGLYGQTYANRVIYNADYLFVLGARMGQRQVGKKLEDYTLAKIVHVDIDSNELGRALEEEVSIVSDLKVFLNAYNKEFLTKENAYTCEKGWLSQIEEWKSSLYTRNELNEGLDPVNFVRKLAQMLPEESIMTADVGQNQMWVAQGLEMGRGLRVLNSSGYGSMGFSLPAAIGASIAHPQNVVCAFMGDGGLHMNIQELEFLKLHHPNVKCIVFNNNTLGMMREVQKLYYNNHFYGSNIEVFQSPDLEKLADAYGVSYVCIESINDLDVLSAVFEKEDSYIIDCRIQFESLLINRYDELLIIKERLYEG